MLFASAKLQLFCDSAKFSANFFQYFLFSSVLGLLLWGGLDIEDIKTKARRGSRHNDVYLRRKRVSDRSLALLDKPRFCEANSQIINPISNHPTIGRLGRMFIIIEFTSPDRDLSLRATATIVV